MPSMTSDLTPSRPPRDTAQTAALAHLASCDLTAEANPAIGLTSYLPFKHASPRPISPAGKPFAIGAAAAGGCDTARSLRR